MKYVLKNFFCFVSRCWIITIHLVPKNNFSRINSFRKCERNVSWLLIVGSWSCIHDWPNNWLNNSDIFILSFGVDSVSKLIVFQSISNFTFPTFLKIEVRFRYNIKNKCFLCIKCSISSASDLQLHHFSISLKEKVTDNLNAFAHVWISR